VSITCLQHFNARVDPTLPRCGTDPTKSYLLGSGQYPTTSYLLESGQYPTTSYLLDSGQYRNAVASGAPPLILR